MEKHLQYCGEIKQLLEGKIKANEVSEPVEQWLKLTCYSLAYEVAKKPTKEARRLALEQVNQMQPLFYDDVSAIAKQIYKELNQTGQSS